MNAYVAAFDPDGAYFAPLARAPARPGQAGHVGVGLVLKKRGEWITVQDMASGGAAGHSGRLHAGDRIVGVAQGAGQPVTDVVGWDVDEVVTALRGAPGSTVVLHVVPGGSDGDGAPRSVALVRGAVAGPEHAQHATAKLEVIERHGAPHRIAVVTVPTFYEDFAAKRAGVPDYASMTREVGALLADMKAQRADAVLLDMRRNGGGSLAEAIGLAGLFLPRAPVALQRNFDGKIDVQLTSPAIPAWDGPLAVLIDEGSAAGTEIVAAALQDHGRGLVVGDRSVGRSTVQTLVSLDRLAQDPAEHYGDLKMTVAQVYRVTGDTFEQAGLVPDIDVPGARDPSGRAHQLAFPTKPIKPAGFSPRDDLKAVMPALVQRHHSRTAADPAYQAMLRARRDPSFDPGVDPDRAGLAEALQVVGDQVELLGTRPAAAR